MKLKEQTVYIPITEYNENTVPIVTAKFYGYGQSEEPIIFEKWNLICLSKEEIIELLGVAMKFGEDFYWDKEYAGTYNQSGDFLEHRVGQTKEQFINQLIR